MLTLNLRTLTVFALATLALGAMAQPQAGPRQGGNRMRAGFQIPDAMHLMRADVQKDLKITEQQKVKLTEIMSSAMPQRGQAGAGGGRPAQGGARPNRQQQGGNDFMARMKETEKKMLAVLSADQKKRLTQIGIQLAGGRALRRDDVSAALKLTGAQKNKLTALDEKMQAANMAIMQKVRANELTRDQATPLFEKNQKAFDVEALKLLTPDQAKKLEAMKGPKFAADPSIRGGFGGMRGGPGGARGNRGGGGPARP